MEPKPTTKSLHRNKACLQCRARKTKCDGVKPVCSGCKKTQAGCKYDEPPRWLGTVIRRNNLNKAEEEEKIARLEQKLERLQHQLQLKLQHLPHLKRTQTENNTSSNPFFSSPSPSTTSSIPDLLPSSPPVPLNLIQPSQTSPESFLPICEPNWLSHLPPRQTCKFLIRAFFNRPLSPFTLVEPIQFQSRIELSSSDPKFPEPALIHAICAIGSQYVSVQDLYPIYWSPPSSSPHLHHAQWAERLLNNGIYSDHQTIKPQKLIQLSEAAVLSCQYYTLVGKPLMIWKSLGYSIRLATLLGLHTHYQPYNQTLISHPHLHHSKSTGRNCNSSLENDLVTLWPDGVELLENPSDHRIQHYRTILWWYVFCCDKMCAAAGGFASTIDERDSLIPIYNPLRPSVSSLGQTNLVFEQDDCHVFDPQSPSFFFQHQVGEYDSLQLLIKAAILLGRVNTSLYRRPHPAKSITQINHEYEELSSLTWGLFHSIPDCLKNPFRFNQTGHLDPCLLSAHTLIHTALIQLNEDLVESKPSNQRRQQENQNNDDGDDQHLKICKESGKVLIDWFLELIRWKNMGWMNVDLGDLLCGNPALNFGLSVALRTHCRLIAIKRFNHQLVQLQKLELQIEQILSHLKKSQKMPLEGRVVALITSLLNSPWALLPQKNSSALSLSSTRMILTKEIDQDNPSTSTLAQAHTTKRSRTEPRQPIKYVPVDGQMVDNIGCGLGETMKSNFALAQLLNSKS